MPLRIKSKQRKEKNEKAASTCFRNFDVLENFAPHQKFELSKSAFHNDLFEQFYYELITINAKLKIIILFF